MRNIAFLLAVLMVSCCAAPQQMTGRDYCVQNGFKPGTKTYLSCLKEYNRSLEQQYARQQYYQQRPSPIEELTNRTTQIWSSQQPTSHCETREELGRLVTDCR